MQVLRRIPCGLPLFHIFLENVNFVYVEPKRLVGGTYDASSGRKLKYETSKTPVNLDIWSEFHANRPIFDIDSPIVNILAARIRQHKKYFQIGPETRLAEGERYFDSRPCGYFQELFSGCRANFQGPSSSRSAAGVAIVTEDVVTSNTSTYTIIHSIIHF